MRLRVKCLGAFSLMLCLLMCVGVSLAQNPTAVLTGQVTDSSGATIAGAQVQVRNNDTNISREVQTDDAGRYLISNLNPGPYDLTVEAQGFEKVSVTKLTLAVAQEAHQDVVLTVGSGFGGFQTAMVLGHARLLEAA